MKAYYDSHGVTIFNCDAREIMQDIDVDLIIADPPYNVTACTWDKWPDGWPSIAHESLKPSGSMWCFGSLRMFWDRKDEFELWQIAQDVIWEKHNGSGARSDRFNRVHEQPVQFYPKRSSWEAVHKSPVYTMDAKKRTATRSGQPKHFGKMGPSTYRSREGGPRLQRSVIYNRSMHGKALNETEKPTGIISPLIRYSCPDGGLILDPFMGSGAVCITARNLGRRAIGVEIREEQCEIAAKRLEQLNLFQQSSA